MTACPPDDSLMRLLADELGDLDRTVVEGHVEACEACQAKLAEWTDSTIGDRIQSHESPPEHLPTHLLVRLGSSVDAGDAGPIPRPELPGYEILDEVGRGGMGVVYRARDVRLNRIVAIKMLLDSKYATAEVRLRFRIEGEAVARLQHPGIVQVYECGEAEGHPFLAMEFVPGLTLADHLNQAHTPFAPREVAEFLANLTDAVAAAHSSGVIHRDLKPSNILLAEVIPQESGSRRAESRERNGSSTLDPTLLVPKVSDFGLAKIEGTDLTRTGALMGTPSYMAPEQAGGRPGEIGTPTDVYALGAILYQLLSGRPPFEAATVLDTLYQVLHHEPPRIGSLLSGIPRDLETICHRCLEKEPKRRYRSADALGADLRAFLSNRVIAARPAGVIERTWKWGRRNPGATAAIAAAAAILIGIFVGTQEARRAVREQERVTRAGSLVDGLVTANTAEVPRLVRELDAYSTLVGPKLTELAAQSVEIKAGLHARLALLSHEPERAEELARYIPNCRSDELTTLNESLKPYARGISPPLWSLLSDPITEGGRAVRAACVLAALAPDDPRWGAIAPTVAQFVVLENPLQASVWAQALEPVGASLFTPLLKRYETAREGIQRGNLEDSALITEATALDVAAGLLARYSADRPAHLAELAVTVEARHHALLRRSILAREAEIVPLLVAELRRAEERAPESPKQDGSTPDQVLNSQAKRRANAAAVLFTLGKSEHVWPLFTFPKAGDPSTRSYLQQRLAAIGADPVALVRRFEAEQDLSAKRALLIALGDFPLDVIPPEDRANFRRSLLALYETTPDSGLHGAIDWLLRRKWRMAAEVTGIDNKLARQAQATKDARHLARLTGATLPLPGKVEGKDWFVNASGQTYAVIRGPVKFDAGSPEGEPDRATQPPHRAETLHQTRIDRTFALATREISVQDFLKSYPAYPNLNPDVRKRYTPEPDTPVILVEWYECAKYCNWLNEREGIPRHQWCYEPNKQGAYADGMTIKPNHLALTGYRLPTEAEWEYACRAGSVVSRHYGRGDELLSRYEWYPRSSRARSWPAGSLRPNDLGMFDMLGNVMEWVGDIAAPYDTTRLNDVASDKPLIVTDGLLLRVRGGAYEIEPLYARSAHRTQGNPNTRMLGRGFRPARTLP